MASHPGYDPNLLDEQGTTLASEQDAPLLNRATNGNYPLDTALSPFAQALFGEATAPGKAERDQLYRALGFYSEPQLRMLVSRASKSPDDLRVSPLQMALATAALSNNGVRPSPRIALAVNTPQQGWVILPALGESVEALPAPFARETAQALARENPYWSYTSVTSKAPLTWYLAGTLPDWGGTPLALVVLLEENNQRLADEIGGELINMALQP